MCKDEEGPNCCCNTACCHNQSDSHSLTDYHPGHAATLQADSERRIIDCACISLFVACETIYYYVVKKNT